MVIQHSSYRIAEALRKIEDERARARLAREEPGAAEWRTVPDTWGTYTLAARPAGGQWRTIAERCEPEEIAREICHILYIDGVEFGPDLHAERLWAEQAEHDGYWQELAEQRAEQQERDWDRS